MIGCPKRHPLVPSETKNHEGSKRRMATMNFFPRISHHLFVEAAGRDGQAHRKHQREAPVMGLPRNAAVLTLEVLDAATELPAHARRVFTSSENIGADSV
jgi:hypothetical protein